MISIQRIQARDRRQAAIHESGHAIISEHLGYKAYARIFPNADALTQDPIIDNTWLGRTTRRISREPDDEFKISVAGGIAEYFWLHKNEDYDPLTTLDWDDNAYLIFEERMSPSDKETAGLKQDYYDDIEDQSKERHEIASKILEAAQLVYNLWPDIVQSSRELIDISTGYGYGVANLANKINPGATLELGDN